MALKKITALNNGDLFKIQMYCLRFIGIWPGPVLTGMQVQHVMLATINGLFLSCAAISEIVFAYKHKTDLQLALDSLCPATSKTVMAIKIFILVARRNKIKELLNDICDLCLKDLSDHSITINKRLSKYELFGAASLFVLGNATLFSFLAVPMVKKLIGISNDVWELPFKADIPYFYRKSPNYELTYLALSYSGFLTTFTVAGLDALFLACCLYVSGQFNILEANIDVLAEQEIADSERSLVFSAAENKRLESKLIDIIEKHNRCISLAENMVKIFSPIVLTQIISAAFILAMTSIDLILATGVSKLIFLIYMVAAFFQMFSFCVSATILSNAVIRLSGSFITLLQTFL